jgi:F-type H+-transporting ATPase subunit epsilon
MQLDLITPRGSVLSESVTEVIVPAIDGLMGILNGHANMLAALGDGMLTVKKSSGSEVHMKLEGGGFLQVEDNTVYVLAESALPLA